MASKKTVIKAIGAIKTVYNYFGKDTDIELLEDMDNKISAVDYFNCLSDSLDEFDERAWNKRVCGVACQGKSSVRSGT